MPANTAHGYPYVLPADHPLEYPATSQQLAQQLETDWNARGIWTTWVPTITGCVVQSVSAEYTKTGRTVVVAVKLLVTSMTGPLSISTPVAVDTLCNPAGIGVARMIVAAGVYYGMVLVSGGSSIGVQTPGTDGIAKNLTATVPATWQAGNQIAFTATYKAAS